MKTKQLLSTALIALGLCATQAHASLIGSSATHEYRFPTAGAVYQGEGLATGSATVGDGVEFANSYFSIDIQANRIVYNLLNTSWNNGVEHNGPRITFAGVNIDFAALDLAATTYAGTGLVFTWAPTYVDLNWGNFAGNTIVIDLNSQPSDVPEPASLALLAAGLAGVRLVRRRVRA